MKHVQIVGVRTLLLKCLIMDVIVLRGVENVDIEKMGQVFLGFKDI